MKTYLYPQNLKARANLWLWSLRDFVILCAAVLVSAVIFLNSGIVLPAALALCFGLHVIFLTLPKQVLGTYRPFVVGKPVGYSPAA